MNINIRKIGALLLLLFSIFTLAACQNITEEVTVESIQVEISTLNPNYNVDDFDLSTISIRVTFSDGKFQIIPITESMLTEEHLSLLSNVGEHQITITYQGKSTTINLNLQYDSLKTQLMTLYTLSTTSGSFSGTYEEWLETVRGPQGNPGREVLFQVAEGYIQWQYTGDSSWTNLVELTSLVGPAGADGVNGIDGKQVTFQVSEGFIQWQYVGDETWTNLVSLSTLTGSNGTDGVDGREVLFQVADGFIQWQYTGDTEWINLIDTTSLNGMSAYELYKINYPDYQGDESQWIYDLTNGLLAEEDSYTVTLHYGNASLPSGFTASFEVGNYLDNLPTPMLTGYSFVGWFTGFTENDIKASNLTYIQTDITLYALFIPDFRTIEIGSTDNLDLGNNGLYSFDYINSVREYIDGIDYTKIGRYESVVLIEDSFGNLSYYSIYTEIIDTTKPYVEGALTQEIELDVDFENPQVGCSDNSGYCELVYDFSNFEDEPGYYEIPVYAIDESGNESVHQVLRVTLTDTQKPEIVITQQEIDIMLGEEFIEPGYAIIDNVNHNLSPQITSTVNINQVGVYEIRYNVVDLSGNIADEVIRTVNVISIEGMMMSLPNHVDDLQKDDIFTIYKILETEGEGITFHHHYYSEPAYQNFREIYDFLYRGGFESSGLFYVEDDYVYYDKSKVLLVRYIGTDKDIIIDDNVRRIGVYALAQKNLENVVLPPFVTELMAGAFYQNNIENINFPSTLTTIGSEVFLSNRLSKVNLPDNITKIGYRAFQRNQIYELTLPRNLEFIGDGAFGSNSITHLEIPDRLIYIGKETFYNNKLEHLDINNVVFIGEGSFSYNNISSLVLNNRIKVISKQTFFHNELIEITIPNGVIEIETASFSNNMTVEHISLGNSLEIIGDSAFGYNLISELILPASLKSIGDQNFSSFRLKNIVLPKNLEYLGLGSFYFQQLDTVTIDSESSKLKIVDDMILSYDGTILFAVVGNNINNLVVPDGVEEIRAYLYLHNIDSLYFPDSVVYFERIGIDFETLSSFDIAVENPHFNFINNLILSEDGTIFYVLVGSHESVVIPEGVEVIKTYAIYGTDVVSVTLPFTLIEIEDYALAFNEFTSITIPDSVISIGEAAFRSNQIITLELGSSLEFIGDAAFFDNRISEVIIPDSVTYIGNEAFSNNVLSKIFIGINAITIEQAAFSSNPLEYVFVHEHIPSDVEWYYILNSSPKWVYSSFDAPGFVNYSQDQTIMQGSYLDLMSLIKAYDYTDGDLTNLISVNINDTSLLSVGVYDVIYSVTDTDGNMSQYSFELTVTNDSKYMNDDISNVIVFVKFADENLYDAPFNQLYYEDMYNGTLSLQDYFLDSSYGEFLIDNYFINDVDYFYIDFNERGYYEPYHITLNPIGYMNDQEKQDREEELLENVIEWINSQYLVTNNMILDRNEDMMLDSLQLLISNSPNVWGELLWPHEGSSSIGVVDGYYTDDSLKLGSLFVSNYSILPLGEDALDSMKLNLGLLTHEFMHVLGAPDLYHYDQFETIDSVYIYDNLNIIYSVPNFNLQYIREQLYNIDDVQVSEDGIYTLYSTSSDVVNMIIINTGYSNEYIIIEYRQTGIKYDINIPNDGVLVYRVDLDYYGNMNGLYGDNDIALDEVLIFRDFTFDQSRLTNDNQYIIIDGSDYASMLLNINDSIGYNSTIPLFFSDGTEMGINIMIVQETNNYVSVRIDFE